MSKKQVSQSALFQPKAEEPYQVNLDEIPLTEVLKHIERVSGVQSLCYIQRCIEKFRISQQEKKCREGRGIAVRENSGKPNKLLETTGSNNEKIHSENCRNKSEMLETVIHKSRSPVEKQIDICKLRMAHKILPFTQAVKKNPEIPLPLPEKVIEIELGAGNLTNALTEAEHQELKKVVNALRVKINGVRGKGTKPL